MKFLLIISFRVRAICGIVNYLLRTITSLGENSTPDLLHAAESLPFLSDGDRCLSFSSDAQMSQVVMERNLCGDFCSFTFLPRRNRYDVVPFLPHFYPISHQLGGRSPRPSMMWEVIFPVLVLDGEVSLLVVLMIDHYCVS